MGKRGGKRGGGFGKGRGRGGGQTVRTDRQDVPRSNLRFEGYYNSLGIFKDEQEQDEFWTALRRDLPNSFRFTGSKGHALQVQRRLEEHYLPEIISINFEGEPVDPPSQLAWFPDRLAWQMTTPKNVIRRFPPFASFQKFLVSETAVGNISRQEVVSMIPPLVLDVKPGMTVLDLCAAPGSKSAQLIEMVHGGEEARMRKVVRDALRQEGRDMSPDGEAEVRDLPEEQAHGDWSDDGRSSGLLIANDVDSKRAHMLIHQMKRLNSPNLIVTNHDASQFPSIKLKPLPVAPGQSQKGRYLKFDRILADVPCSGDGTARKNINVWKDWSPMNSIGLHAIQCRILVRAIQMLKVGGRVVYSTCSMNPVENEAVVSTAIDRCGGLEKIELLDSISELPGLIRSNGLTKWKVIDKYGEQWSSWQEVVTAQEDQFDDHREKLAESMFPSESTDMLPLRRCMRFYPHHQDTGSFFVAILEKKSEIKARPEQNKKTSSAHPPITSIVNELESKAEYNQLGGHIEAANRLLPISNDSQEVDNPSAAARQNMENDALNEGVTDRKRKLDDRVDSEQAAKRPAFREEIDAVAPRGEEKRQVHYPPPPAAQLDLTAHDHAYHSGLTAPNKTSKSLQTFEEPFKYLDPGNEALDSIYAFYKVNARFPRDRFLVRNAAATASKKVYYTSALAKEILTENEGKGMKFVHAGVNMFVRQDVQSDEVCRWRIQLDGLPLIAPWVGEGRVMRLHSRTVFRKLLIEMFPKVTGNGWRELGEIGPQALDMAMGCCVLRVETSDGEDGFSERMTLPIWRSLHSLNLMLPKEDRKAMLLRLYNDDTPLVDHTKDRFNKNEVESTSISEIIDDGQEAREQQKQPQIEVPRNDEDTGSDEEQGGVSLIVNGA